MTGSIVPASDLRLKEDIEAIRNALDIVAQLNARKYIFKQHAYADLDLPAETQYGLIAQEVEKVLPELVVRHTSTLDENGQPVELKGVNYTALIPILLAAIQEQQAIIDAQQQQIDDLEAYKQKVDALQQQMEQLMELVKAQK